MARFTVKNYSVVLSDRGDYGWIMVFEEGSSRRARLDFVSGSPIAPNVRSGGDFITVRMHPRMFNRTIDILRNEGPIDFIWGPYWAGLATDTEPVGEGEELNP